MVFKFVTSSLHSFHIIPLGTDVIFRYAAFQSGPTARMFRCSALERSCACELEGLR